MSLAGFYARFRGSTLFLWTLLCFCSIWVGLHKLLGFDPGWGLLNLILSMEASISVAILIMAEEASRARDTAHRKYILHLLEAQVAHMELLQAAIRGSQGNSSIGGKAQGQDDGAPG